MYHLDPNLKIPLHIQLYKAIKREIISQHRVGDKLPSIRKTATLYHLSKTTVEAAYAQLYAEGYIESRARSGYYVSELYFDAFEPEETSGATPAKITEPVRYDFFPAQLHTEDFPLKTWKRLCTRETNASLDFGAYPDGQGEEILREEIARYLSHSRGVRCHADQVIVTHGFIDGMELIAKLGRERYQRFGHELPGYHIAHKIFGAYGYRTTPIEVGRHGLRLEKLRHSKAQVVYITPSHQYPTGVTMPITKRLKLLAHIQSIDGLIIEDDYDSELAYYNRPIPSLQGLDTTGEHVAYVGTFAKALSPAIRVGYLVLPEWMMAIYRKSYDAHFARVSLITQRTLAAFMHEGHWDRHIRRTRILNQKKHQAMREALIRHLGDTFRIVTEGAGLAILIQPRASEFDWQRLKQVADEKRIAIYLAKERSGGEFEAARMGFGGFRLEEIDTAVAAFAECWMKIKD